MPVNKFKPVGANADAQEVEHDIHGDGGSTVVANPELSGDEEVLEGLEIDGTKYKVPQPSEPVASLKLFKHILSSAAYEVHIVSAKEDAYESMADILGDEGIISMKAVKKDVSLDCPLLKSSSTSAFKVVVFGEDSVAMSDLAFADLDEDSVEEIVNN